MSKLRVVLFATVAVLVAACSSAPPRPKAPDLTGEWVLTTESQMGSQDADMSIRQNGQALTGKLSSQLGTVDYTGTLNGNAVAFGFSMSLGGNDLRLDYSGTVEGDTMKGTASFGGMGEGTFTARRKT